MGDGLVGEWSAVTDGALSPFPLVLFPCLAAKSEKLKLCKRGCEEGVDSEEVKSKWLKGGSLA